MFTRLVRLPNKYQEKEFQPFGRIRIWAKGKDEHSFYKFILLFILQMYSVFQNSHLFWSLNLSVCIMPFFNTCDSLCLRLCAFYDSSYFLEKEENKENYFITLSLSFSPLPVYWNNKKTGKLICQVFSAVLFLTC